MIHQPMTEISGQASDIKIHANEILKLKRKLNEILAKEARRSITKVEEDTERDFFMSASEAKKYGIIDSVVEAKNRKLSPNSKQVLIVQKPEEEPAKIKR